MKKISLIICDNKTTIVRYLIKWLTFISALTSSSVLVSICLVSINLVKVDSVITCELFVSIPAQLVKMLAAAMASNTFFWVLTTWPSSSCLLFLVKSPKNYI